MAKRKTAFDLALPPRDAGISAYRWLYASLRAVILEGRLSQGARLPATRELASQYGLSRGTIINAFEQLKSEGYVEGSVGSGTYVSQILPDELLQVRRDTSARLHVPRKRAREISDYAERVKLFPNFELRATRAFRAHLPALDLFPVALWAQVAARRLRRCAKRWRPTWVLHAA